MSSSSSNDPSAHVSKLTWILRGLVAVLVPVMIFFLVEGALKLSGYGFPMDATRPCMVGNKAMVCDNFLFGARFMPFSMLRTPRPYAFPAEKAAGTYRIVVIGESAAYGDPDPAYGFSRYLELMLRSRYPGVNFEVINSSITATNSYAMLPIVRDMVAHQADLFIVYTGSNEVVGPFGAGTVFTSTSLPLPLIRASIWLNSTSIGQFVNNQRSLSPKKRQEWRGMEMFLSKQIPWDSPALSGVYSNFEANLRDSIAVAHRGGAQVLLSTVVTNLRDCAPFASAHRSGLKSGDLKNWEQWNGQGISLENSGDIRGALQAYQKAAEIDPTYAELQFRMARCFVALGDDNGAREAFQKAREFDTLHFRAGRGINGVIKQVAQSEKGAQLLDAEALFAAASPHGVVGNEFLCDHVHFMPEGNYLLARSMFDKISTMVPPAVQAKSTGGDVMSQEECEKLLALTKYDRARLAQDNLRRISHPPYTDQLNHEEQVERLTPLTVNPETPEETAQQYRFALQQNPTDTMLHMSYGQFLSRFDREAALNEFRQARPYTDVPFVLPDGSVLQ